MLRLFSFIKSIIQTLFLFIGAVAVVIIVAGLYAYGVASDRDSLVIESSPRSKRLPLDLEAGSLYPALKARADEINTPLTDDPGVVEFKVGPGDTAPAVAARLQAMGLISEAELFGQLLRYNGIDTRLQIGEYRLRRNMSMKKIATVLYQGYTGQNVLVVHPGWRLEEIATQLINAGMMDGNRFLRLAREGTIVNHPLLADRPANHSYEGYLLAGTYHLPDDPTPEYLIAVMLDNLARKLPFNALDLARQQGLTFHEVLTLASIIERETALTSEMPLIASVYLNRLSPTSSETHLRADPTVQYAMGYQRDTGQWWKSPVTLDEYPSVDSPYNTYLYPGLPPGPIASPSLESIMAVLNPANTDYLFFVCQHPRCEGGTHVFARTYEEHLQNVAVYYGQ